MEKTVEDYLNHVVEGGQEEIKKKYEKVVKEIQKKANEEVNATRLNGQKEAIEYGLSKLNELKGKLSNAEHQKSVQANIKKLQDALDQTSKAIEGIAERKAKTEELMSTKVAL